MMKALQFQIGTAVGILIAGCGQAPATISPAPVTTTAAAATDTIRIPPLQIPWIAPPQPVDTTRERGVEFRLLEVPALPAGPDTTPTELPSEPLSPAATTLLLARLPALPDSAPPAFRFPAASPPPPRTGAIVTAAFGADTADLPIPPVAPQTLQVVRIVPSGETELAPSLTISFNQPMVPLTTVAGTASRQPPARLTPQPPGRWSWLDPRTLRFEPARRFPMATEYEVEVPAGTRAVNGQTLGQAVTARFATPAPRALGAYPALDPDTARQRLASMHREGVLPQLASAVTLEPVVLVTFDQEVAPEAVLAATRLTANGAPHGLRLATAAELAADTVARALVEAVEAGRWVAFRPAAPLPRNADVRLVIQPGPLSAEGPRATGSAQELRFRTYGPLDVVWTGCWDTRVCLPGAPWTIRFNNPLDTASSRPQLRIEPALGEFEVRAQGTELRIVSAQMAADTRYTVTIGGDVVDRFGQRLGRPRTVTFSTGARQPTLLVQGGPMIVLDPAGPPRVRVQSHGHRSFHVRVLRVTPTSWPEFTAALRRWYELGVFEFPGTAVHAETIRIEGSEFADRLIDIGPALANGLGHAIVVVEPTDSAAPAPARRRSRGGGTVAWVQATRIGLAAAVDGDEVLGWATSLDTGEPLPGVTLRLVPYGTPATTDARGVAALPLGTSTNAALLATRGADTALLPESEHAFGTGWHRQVDPGTLRWLLFSDRGLYRPGETARVKGWLREQTSGRTAALALPRSVTSLSYRLRGPRGEDLGTGELRPGPLGGFDTALELPASLNLGQASLEVTPAGVPEPMRQTTQLSLDVQEFRRPDYEVQLAADPGPHVIGDVVDFELSAKYFGGGGLGGAMVEWRVRTEEATYSPPGWSRWHFGRVPLWWFREPRDGPTRTLTGTTDAAGSHRTRVELASVDPPYPARLVAEAQVHDVTRQVGSASSALLVHPADLTVGLRATRNWVRPGDTTSIAIIVVNHDGRAVSGRPVQLVQERVTWTHSPFRPPELRLSDERVSCDVASADDPVSCSIRFAEPGLYRLRADVADDARRVSRTELMIWVPGGPAPPRPDAGAVELTADRPEYQPGDTALIAVAAPFFPAEGLMTIRRGAVLAIERFRVTGPGHELRVPITEAHIPGVIIHVDLLDATIGTRWASSETHLAVPPRTRTLNVGITPRDTVATPGAETVIDVQVRDAAGRPAAGAEVALWMVDEAILAVGGYQLPDPLSAFYQPHHRFVRDHASRMWVIPWPRSHGPGTVAGRVLGGIGGTASRGVTVRIEGTEISAVTGYDGEFVLRGVAPGDYVLRIEQGAGSVRRANITVPASGVHLGNIVLGTGELQLEVVSAAQLDMAAAAPPPPPPAPGMVPGEYAMRSRQAKAQEVELRADFAPLALFEPSLRTDANGRTRARVRLPGSLTRYRVMAVAVSGAQHFGTGEATVTARKELMARINAPRFLNFGDRFELPVLVQNSTTERLSVDVAARGTGVHFTGAQARRVVLPPGGRTELRFTAAAVRAGTARIQVIAAAGSRTDATRVDVPTYTPATTEAFAQYGVIDTNAPVVIPVSRPRAVIAEFGGAEITITSTALHALTDAVLYLHTYPFMGAEQLSSRILAVAALRPVLTAFAAAQLPSPDELIAATRNDVTRLSALQNPDGGWGFWYAGEPSHPFVSVHAAHALQRARDENFAVQRDVILRALEYLRRIDAQLTTWPLRERQSVRAYALYVRHRLGDDQAVAEARALAGAQPDRVGGELPLEAAAWLLDILAGAAGSSAVAAELQRYIMNRATETAGGVTFTERYDDGQHLLLHSRRRTDAVVLDALIAADRDSELIPKLANTLLAHRVRGRWSGTQENAWMLLALNRYFRTYEANAPDFQSRVWLGDRFAGGHTFSGRTTERQHISIPMPELIRQDSTRLLIARQGEGRMYYRAGLRYAPADLEPDALDRGFSVSRVYEAMDDSLDVSRGADGTWHVRAGARVRVRVLMHAPALRSHVALVDPLPAGFEPLNPELRGTGFTDDPQPRPDPRGPRVLRPVHSWWFVHQNLRDDRAEAFATLLPAGVYEYAYLARATTPGTFVVPPPRAEMLYEPETFGRGSGDTVIVGARDR